MKPTIIGFNEQTATISIGLKYGCLTVDDTATFKVWEQACDKYEATCIPATLCNPAKYTKTLIQPISVTFPYAGKDSNGRAIFTIPQAIKDSPQAYWQGEMTMCGRKVKVNLQKNSNTQISSASTSFVTGYVDYLVNLVVVGQVATIGTTCLRAPNGWVTMKDCVTGAIIGYAPTTSGDGFCKPYTQTCYGCSNVYLK